MATISGIDEVMKNLNKVVDKIQGNITPGLIKCSILVRRDMENTPPKIPVDEGNLRASWFTVVSKGVGGEKGGDFRGEKAGDMSNDHQITVTEAQSMISQPNKSLLAMGFSAHYALWVHENVDANFAGRADKLKFDSKGKVTAKTRKYSRRPGAGAKFFESSLKRNQVKMISIIAKEVQIP